MSFGFPALAFVSLVAIVSAALAQENEKKKKPAETVPQVLMNVVERAESLGLSDDQARKIKLLAEAYAPKIREAGAKLILTPEQKRARGEAVAKNKAEGKIRKEADAAIEAAIKLTDEQKQAQLDAQETVRELTKQFDDEVDAFLSPAQQVKFRALRPRKLQ